MLFILSSTAEFMFSMIYSLLSSCGAKRSSRNSCTCTCVVPAMWFGRLTTKHSKIGCTFAGLSKVLIWHFETQRMPTTLIISSMIWLVCCIKNSITEMSSFRKWKWKDRLWLWTGIHWAININGRSSMSTEWSCESK